MGVAASGCLARRVPSGLPLAAAAFLLLVLVQTVPALAHDISEADRLAVQQLAGPAPMTFLNLGAKHMVTGIDHILFLVGVVFFLHRLRDVVIYVSLFTVGHSITLIGGVLFETGANAYLVDAIIGFSVVYKGLENLGGFEKLGISVDTRLAVLVFGLFHGLGLATKVRELGLQENGLLPNLLSFNLGVEVGQLLVLTVVVVLFNFWRPKRSFAPSAFYANLALITAGLMLVGYQLTGYFTS